MRLFGVVPAASDAVSLSKAAAAVLRSAETSDDEKEAAARQLSVKLLLRFATIIGRTLAALLVPTAFLVLLDAAALLALDGVVAALESWTVILCSVIFIPLLMVRWR
jgi:hypothetical protein